MYLVNPQFLKQLPGRKSDVRDAEWIATSLLKELVRNSFVPDGKIQQLRGYGRRIHELNRDMVRCNQRIDMIMQGCNIRFSNYVANTNSKSYMKVVEAIIGGQTNPEALVKLVHARTLNAHGRQVIRDSLEGNVGTGDMELLGQYTRLLAIYREQKQQCLDNMVALCRKNHDREFQILQTIPGIREQSAAIIISEIGDERKLIYS